jgi:Protein of unknown function (DUF1553)/Protein of unknown function (DUF1549)/Planctomycete cytochrome C/NedA-like, galactose-binding domain
MTTVGVNAQEVDFNLDVRPILSSKCLLCHGPDEEELQGGLRLDVKDIALGELESGATAIVPGNLDASELISRIMTDDDDLRMPPSDSGKHLTSEEVATLRRWIEQGAPYAQHWAYEKPTRWDIPAVPDEFASWPKNPIDNFTLQRMLQHGLKPSAEAERYALVRRVYLDLIGLPPTLEEADAFVANSDPNAYAQLVDDLLQRPEFGEHWALKWLDLARYADSAGYADDPARTIWAWRDWVIRAFNSGMPFDQFTIEQLAGDMLPNPTEDQLLATAFHRNTMTNNEGGTQDEEFRNVAIIDRVNTTMAVWMGTTMACAQCHSHKYDPISQEEYFQFFAILNNTQDADRKDESPILEIFTEAQRGRRADLETEVADLKTLIDTPTPALEQAQRDWEARLSTVPEWRTLRPGSVVRNTGLPIEISDDGVVFAEKSAETDTYVLEFALEQSPPSTVAETAGEDQGEEAASEIAAIRLNTLPHDSLPGKGSGHAGGNFVITGITAELVPVEHAAPQARFLRITNNGKAQILSLAEVQVFGNAGNIAGGGTATQHSTGFNGPPQLAIDGNTDGDFQKRSVTHTNTVDDPWWELDLQSLNAVERIVIWNRTDNGLQKRLADFTVELLDEERQQVWKQVVADPPSPSAELSPGNVRQIEFQTAFADYHQPDFQPNNVLSGKNGNTDGWAVGGSVDAPHQLVLVPRRPIVADGPATLRITIEQNSPHKNHLLGRFRVEFTSDGSAIQRSQVPQLLLVVLDKPAQQRSESERRDLANYFRRNAAPALVAERKQLAAAEKQLVGMKPATRVPILRERMDGRRETRLQHRGNYLDVGQVVSAGLPAVFNVSPTDETINRLTLAKWLVDRNNPLTARVVVNRYWETLFGRGIVITSEDFGSQGELPSHPMLLDWLATELNQNNWNTKSLLRLIVTSATYRQTARIAVGHQADDPDNRWMARGPRVRLSAEIVRDQALFVSGLLSDRMYGPPVKPPQPTLGLKAAFGASTDWQTSKGEDRYRRGIYTTWRRSNPYPSMATFDAPNREVCTIRRNSTNTPLQSLVTLNDPVYVEAAQSLARLALQQDGSLEQRLRFAFRRCLIRPPADNEAMALASLYKDSRTSFENAGDEAAKLATDPLGPLPDDIDTLDAAAMTVVTNVLLNLDEMLMKR